MRANMRSTAARPAWNWLQKAERFISGNQKRSMLWMKRNQAPTAMAPPNTRIDPRSTRMAMPKPTRKLSVGKTVARTKPRLRLMP